MREPTWRSGDGWQGAVVGLVILVAAAGVEVGHPAPAGAHAGNSDPAAIHACQKPDGQVRIVAV